MVESWVDFTLNVVAGSVAALCLFEGTRRLCAYGLHRKAVLMAVAAAAVCTMYGAFAYWKYKELHALQSVAQRKPAPAQLPVNWGRGLSAEKKEVVSLARARRIFMENGTLGSYFDRAGQLRAFVPTQEDLSRRERVVAYYSRAEYSAQNKLAEAVLWLIASLVAVVLGIVMSFERSPSLPVEGSENGSQA